MDPTLVDELNKLARQKAIIRMLESSGGKNFAHKPLTSGPNAGQTAGGAYGILPSSLKDFANQSMNRDMPVDLDILTNMDKPADEVTNLLNTNRNFDEKAAEMAIKLLNKKYGDEEKAAYAWRTGHNQSDEAVAKGAETHPYVEAYRKQKALQETQDKKPTNLIQKLLGM